MNLTILPQTKTYDKFSVPFNQNRIEGAPLLTKTEAETLSKRKKVQKILIPSAIAAFGIFCLYCKVGADAIKLAEKESILSATKEEFENYIHSNIQTQEKIDILKKQRANYNKYTNNIAGKVYRGIQRVSKFFKDNFYSY